MIELYCDGSCLANQSPENRRAGAGFVAVEDGEKLHEASEYVGEGDDVTNNVAEYEAVLAALEWRSEERPGEPAVVYTDSNLITNQIRGEWGCNSGHLFPLLVRCRSLLDEDDEIKELGYSKYIDRAHDLAQSGAAQTKPPDESSGSRSKKRRKSKSQRNRDLWDIEPKVLDDVPGPVERPHSGIEPSQIPDELKKRVQWVNWAVVKRDDEEIKMPKQPGSVRRNAKSDDPDTWGRFDEVIDGVFVTNTGPSLPGIGYVLAKKDPYVAIDLDDVRDAETFEIERWARKVIAEFDSYTHVSVSGTGIHIFVRADGIPDEWKNKKKMQDKTPDKEMEVYDGGRFMAFTGHRYEAASPEIKRIPTFEQKLLDIQEKYDWWAEDD